MPIYEYKCNSCDKEFEELRTLQDRDKQIKCPYCNGDGKRRVSEEVDVVYKGSGFYINDSKNKGSKE